MDENKKKLSYDEIWDLLKEPCECKNCLNYEYFGEEDDWQCIYTSAPPCQDFS